MSRTRAWTPHSPVWDWPGISLSAGRRAKEFYEERAAIVEYDSGQSRGTAEIRAYAELIERMHDAGVLSSEHISRFDVIRQCERAALFRRQNVWERGLVSRGGPPGPQSESQ